MPKTSTPKQQSDTTKLKRAMLAGPGEQSLRNILAYAKALEVVQTRMTGAVNLVMN